MSLSEFETKHNNQAIDFDGAFGNQCVDLMNQYLVDVLGINNPIQTLSGGTAFEIYQNASSPLFDKIDNTPDGIPLPGDIVFWNTTVGSAGHVAIFLHGDTNNFTSFDQNWPVNSLCHEQGHDYNGVAGWLHPKQAAGPTMTLDDATFKKLVHNSTAYDLTCDYVSVPHNSDFGEVQRVLDSYKKTISDIEAEEVKLNQQVADSAKQVTQLKEDDSNLGLRNLDLGHKVEDFTNQLKTLWNALGSSTTNDSLKQIDTLKSSHEDVVKQVQPVIDGLADAAIKKTPQKKKDSALKSLANKILSWLR